MDRFYFLLTTYFVYMAILAGGTATFAAEESPQGYTYEGRLYNAAGTAPLIDIVDFKFQIFNAAGTCLLYEEVQLNVDLTLTNGTFALTVGSATGSAKRTVGATGDPGLTMSTIFQNLTATAVPVLICPGGLYTPVIGESRNLKVTVNPHSIGVPQTLTPDYAISSVPQAQVCESLQGIGPAGLIQVSANVTQANMATLTAGAASDASALHHHDTHNDLRYAKIGSASNQDFGSGNLNTTGNVGIGIITPPAANLDIEEVTPTLRLGGTGAGGQATSIDFYGGAGTTYRASIESLDNTSTLKFFTGGNAVGNLAMQIDSAQNTTFSKSVSVTGTLGFGNYTTVQETTPVVGLLAVLTGLGVAARGATWINSTTGIVRYWDGAAAQSVATLSGTTLSGDVTGTLGATVVGALQGRAVSSIAPLNGQVLTWVAGSTDWEPQPIVAGVSSVFGRAGAVVAVANDYTWAQVDKTVSSIADLTTKSATDITSGTLNDLRLSSNVPLKNAANIFSTGAQEIDTGALATKGLIIKGFAGQTANLQEWQNSAGTVLYSVENTGSPVAGTDVANRAYVATAITTNNGSYLPLAGGTMTGPLTNNSNSASTALAVAQSGAGYAATFTGGKVGIGVLAPTADLHLAAGTGGANTAPLKFNLGINLAAPEAGAVEYDGTNMYFTDNGAVRRTLATTTGVAGSYVAKAGDTMTGPLVNNSNSVSTALAVTQAGAGYAATFMGGNVGVGNAAPAYNLDVTGTIHSTGTMTVDAGAGTSSSTLNLIGRNVGVASSATIDANSTGGISINPNAGAPSVGILLNPTAGASFQVGGSASIGYPVNQVAPANSLIVNSKIGVGNTTPGALLDVGLAGTTLGTMRLEGDTSGYVQIQPATAAGSWTMTLPPTAGTNNFVLSTDGAGITSWVSPAGLASLSGLTAATVAHAIANANFAQTWNWDTLTNQTAMTMASTSMTSGSMLNLTDSNNSAASTGNILNITASGATNASTPIAVSNAGTGTSLKVTNTGTGYAATFNGGNVGIGTAAPVDALSIGTAPTASTTHALVNLSNSALSGAGAFGTLLGANLTPSGGNTADFINFQRAGAAYFSVTQWGEANAQSYVIASNASYWSSHLLALGGWADAGASKITNFFPGSGGGGTLQIGQAGEKLFLMSDKVGIGTTAPGSLLDVGLAGTTLGTMRLEGDTSGFVQIQPATAAGSWTMTLPPTAGTNNFVLSTDGAGVTSWVSAAGLASLSGLTAATVAHAIANANFAQTWNWDTLTNQTAMTMASTSMTSGSILNLTDSNNSAASTGNILNITASGATNASTPISVSNAGTGTSLAVTNSGTGYAATFMGGNVGIATTSPLSALNVATNAAAANSTNAVFMLGNQALNAPSANGTYIGANGTASSFTGNFIDFQGPASFGGAATDIFTVDSKGTLSFQNGGFQSPGLNISVNAGANGATWASFLPVVGNVFTSGTNPGLLIAPSINLHSGVADSFSLVQIAPSTFAWINNIAPSVTALDIKPGYIGYGGGATFTGQLMGQNIRPTFGGGNNADNVFNSALPAIGLQIAPIINWKTTSTAAYVAFQVNPTETSLSSGVTNYLAKFQTGGITKVAITSAGSVGIGTAAPTSDLSLGGNTARTIAMELHTVANTAGNDLTIQAGGATAGSTNKAGGNLNLVSGISTGAGNSSVTASIYSSGAPLQTLSMAPYKMCFGMYANCAGGTAVGYGANATGGYAASLSAYNAAAIGWHGVAIGTQTVADGGWGTALGSYANTGAASNYSMAIGLGTPAGAQPVVSGNNSLGIFMGDQSGVNVSANNTMAVLGGGIAIGKTTAQTTLDVAGGISVHGTTFTAVGCTNSALVGGATVGSFTIGQATSCTITITMGNSQTASNGWSCWVNDLTTAPTVVFRQSATTTTTASFVGMGSINDVFTFGCVGY
jgi:hypothetical protein